MNTDKVINTLRPISIIGTPSIKTKIVSELIPGKDVYVLTSIKNRTTTVILDGDDEEIVVPFSDEVCAALDVCIKYLEPKLYIDSGGYAVISDDGKTVGFNIKRRPAFENGRITEEAIFTYGEYSVAVKDLLNR